jgi:Pyruvate/2-oxoacid:ferredoxin oxidoreductase gamma subunit
VVVVGIIVVALAAGSGYYVFWTGDYGARAVWEGL